MADVGAVCFGGVQMVCACACVWVVAQLVGVPKPKENLRNLLRAVMATRTRRFGSASVSFCTPFHLSRDTIKVGRHRTSPSAIVR